MATVPCNGCVRCCTGDAVRLLEGDDAYAYQTVPHPTIAGARMLDHKPDKSCWYLGPEGCTIQTSKPRMCREFDCRDLAKKISWTIARRAGVLSIWRKGRSLTATGEQHEDDQKT